MKTAKYIAVATVFIALLFLSAQAFAQNNGVYGPWRYSAPYHLPTMGSCIGPFVLKDTDFMPKYQHPLAPVPGPKLPCPPPRKIRKVNPAMGNPSCGWPTLRPPMPGQFFQRGVMPPRMPIRSTPCPGGYCPVS